MLLSWGVLIIPDALEGVKQGRNESRPYQLGMVGA